MPSRKVYLLLATIAILVVFTEVALRVTFWAFGYPVFSPAQYLERHYYPIVEEVKSTELPKGTKSILILGGSVVSRGWTGMDIRLDTLLGKKFPGTDLKVFNVALPGHNSLDNVIKYKLLKDRKFDLVIFYEAINENRANNIPGVLYQPDYGHIKWYEDINLLVRHPELNITVIPYAGDLVYSRIRNKIKKKEYISNDQVDPRFAEYGGDIKTAASYRKNLGEIASIAERKKEKLLLVKYASYFPDGVRLSGSVDDKRYFSPCYVISPVTTWGMPENVKKGIEAHNSALEEIHRSHKTLLFDMSATLPKDSTMFCDVCHLSEQGARVFAQSLSDYIAENELIY